MHLNGWYYVSGAWLLATVAYGLWFRACYRAGREEREWRRRLAQAKHRLTYPESSDDTLRECEFRGLPERLGDK